MKLCPSCNKEWEEKDFFNKPICYVCEYKKKKKLIKRNCKICNKPLPKGRWAYCSYECLKIGKNQKKYWAFDIKNTNPLDDWHHYNF